MHDQIEAYIGDLRNKIELENLVRQKLENELKRFKREWETRAKEIKEIYEKCSSILEYA